METCSQSKVHMLQKNQAEVFTQTSESSSFRFVQPEITLRFPGCWSRKVSLGESRDSEYPSASHPSPALPAGGFI